MTKTMKFYKVYVTQGSGRNKSSVSDVGYWSTSQKSALNKAKKERFGNSKNIKLNYNAQEIKGMPYLDKSKYKRELLRF